MSKPSPPEVRCPKCGSNQIFADKDGFSAAKAAAGALIAGPAGLIAGGLGSGNVNITCLACGFKFKPGENRRDLECTNEEEHEGLWICARGGSGAFDFGFDSRLSVLSKARNHTKQFFIDLLKLIGVWFLVGGGAALLLAMARWVLSFPD